MSDDDHELRERFAHLRAEEARRTPPFSTARGTAGPRRRPRRALARLAAATAAVVALAAAILLRRESLPRPPLRPPVTPPPISIDQWRAPTDFLLQTPGRELLSSVPALGRGLRRGFTSPMPERSTPS